MGVVAVDTWTGKLTGTNGTDYGLLTSAGWSYNNWYPFS